jgi:hypothetical protein
MDTLFNLLAYARLTLALATMVQQQQDPLVQSTVPLFALLAMLVMQLPTCARKTNAVAEME